MDTFNAFEIDRLTRLRDRANQAVLDMLGKLNERADKPGEIAYRLGWDTADLMYQDKLRAAYGQLVEMNGKEDTKATLETLIDHFTVQVIQWNPQHSTNPFSNVEEELKRKVQQNILGELISYKQLRLQDEAEASVTEANTNDTSEQE